MNGNKHPDHPEISLHRVTRVVVRNQCYASFSTRILEVYSDDELRMIVELFHDVPLVFEDWKPEADE